MLKHWVRLHLVNLKSKENDIMSYTIINFGSDIGSTFIDHHDEKKRRAWQARHSKIKNKQGKYVYKLPSSPAFWSWHLLW